MASPVKPAIIEDRRVNHRMTIVDQGDQGVAENDIPIAGDSLAIARYGTSSADPDLRDIGLGPLSFSWQAGALRWLRYGDIEIVRGIAAVLRDPQWGTFAPIVDDDLIALSEDDATLTQTFHLPSGKGAEPCLHGQLRVAASVRQVTVTLMLEANASFPTARSGLSVLLPLRGIVGAPVKVTHTDGRSEADRFPRLISPSQPLFDIRRLEFSPTHDVTLRIDFDGDVFEMEDQRNWSDASFKIYNRPLAWPTPYVLKAGDRIMQQVTVSLLDRDGGSP